MTVSVVIPTLAGREDSLARTLASLAETCPDHELVVLMDYDTVGEGWSAGADSSSGEYIHLAGDDLAWKPGWWEAAARVCDSGALPAPLVWNVDGSVQSCGETMNAVVPDGSETTFARFPFFSREQWRRIRPIPPIHYYSDNWVGDRARAAGLPVRVCHGYSFVHDLGMVEVGWPEGLTWQERLATDRAKYEGYLDGSLALPEDAL